MAIRNRSMPTVRRATDPGKPGSVSAVSSSGQATFSGHTTVLLQDEACHRRPPCGQQTVTNCNLAKAPGLTAVVISVREACPLSVAPGRTPIPGSSPERIPDAAQMFAQDPSSLQETHAL
jgi:hypothetical protein